ncbi:MAG: GUN4 domain-containing protein [Trichodesmium sp. St16_bin2-tuft]|nr:GUN4 domain-containing protein [Trichodesmium sp. St16_bin2-tuft]
MKSLFSILGLSFLSLTLTNCSLSPEQIASRLKPSTEGQDVELEKQLELERQKRREAEQRVEKLEAEQQKELREAELRDKEERAVELQRQLEEEKRQREEAERRERELEAERQRQKRNEVSLVSAKGVDYRKLRDLLKAKKWKEADEETRVKILKVANRESEGWLRYEDAENFSCQDLGTIDKLWVKYSNGKFGFSVQKQIYQEQIYQGMNGSKEFNSHDYVKFGDKVGWRKGGKWLNYSELTFSEKHYTGHLPMERVVQLPHAFEMLIPLPHAWRMVELMGWDDLSWQSYFGRSQLYFSLMWRTVKCNI